jgi:hypothetical protein
MGWVHQYEVSANHDGWCHIFCRRVTYAGWQELRRCSRMKALPNTLLTTERRSGIDINFSTE